MNILDLLKQKIPDSFKPPLRTVLRIYRKIMQEIILWYPLYLNKVAKFKKIKNLKLKVGCGKVKLPGWVNIDIELSTNVIIDVRKGLPHNNCSVNFIHSEYFLEHLTHEEGREVLEEFQRCLKVGGDCTNSYARP